MQDQLTALDATFLELEEADPAAHMHIGAVMIFDPARRGRAPALDEIRGELASRLDRLPRYRQRLSDVATGGLSWPRWEPCERFDIAEHIHRAALPEPGGEEELLEWAGEYFSQRLERTRPLWEIVVVEGLTRGRWAMVSKTHHAMVDGVGSVDVSHVLLDSDPAASRSSAGGGGGEALAERIPSLPGPAGSVAGSAVSAVAGLSKLPLRAARAGVGLFGAGAGAARHPRRIAAAASRAEAMVETIVRDELIAAPHSSLNVPIGERRRLAVSWAPLAELKAVKNAFGGSLNDVVLAVTAGGLRSLLLSRGEPLPSPGLRAMVPVNLRGAGEHLALGNKVSSLFIHLPVSEPDPLRRYRAQVDEAETKKSGREALGSAAMIDFSAHAPPVIHSFLARSMYATRLFNLTITNVPGPPAALYAFGSQMTDVWPLVPLAADHAIGLAVLSYDGKVFFCISADRDAVPDLDVLSDGIEQSFAELRELAGDGAQA